VIGAGFIAIVPLVVGRLVLAGTGPAPDCQSIVIIAVAVVPLSGVTRIEVHTNPLSRPARGRLMRSVDIGLRRVFA
jgi:hypothetical protein